MALVSKDDKKGRCGIETVIGKQSARDKEGDGERVRIMGGTVTQTAAVQRVMGKDNDAEETCGWVRWFSKGDENGAVGQRG